MALSKYSKFELNQFTLTKNNINSYNEKNVNVINNIRTF